MYLHGNPLHCDCQLMELWRWCQDHNIRIFPIESYRLCCTPNQDIVWSVLDEIKCVQDNMCNNGEYKEELYKHPDEEIHTWHKDLILIISVTLIVSLLIFGTNANVILMIIITCNKDMRTVPNMYILNLAISDIILLTSVIIHLIFSLLVPFGTIFEHFCTFSRYWRQFACGLPSYAVAVLSIQRYNMIVNPFYDRVSSQPAWCVIMSTICGVWIVVALFSIPRAFASSYCKVPLKLIRNIPYLKRSFTFEILTFCVLPLFVTAFSYIMAARHLVKSAHRMYEWTQNSQLKERKNVALFMLGLTVVFVISYMPYYVSRYYIILNLHGSFFLNRLNGVQDSNVVVTATVSWCLIMTNSALNPVALFCTSSLFRKHLKRYLCCCCKGNSPPTDIALTRRN